MQNQAFYRTGIFGNFFFGGGEFCVFKTGIPGGPANERAEIDVFLTHIKPDDPTLLIRPCIFYPTLIYLLEILRYTDECETHNTQTVIQIMLNGCRRLSELFLHFSHSSDFLSQSLRGHIHAVTKLRPNVSFFKAHVKSAEDTVIRQPISETSCRRR